MGRRHLRRYLGFEELSFACVRSRRGLLYSRRPVYEADGD
jgi:hypothetical protein